MNTPLATQDESYGDPFLDLLPRSSASNPSKAQPSRAQTGYAVQQWNFSEGRDTPARPLYILPS